jgi:hypothetical protein
MSSPRSMTQRLPRARLRISVSCRDRRSGSSPYSRPSELNADEIGLGGPDGSSSRPARRQPRRQSQPGSILRHSNFSIRSSQLPSAFPSFDIASCRPRHSPFFGFGHLAPLDSHVPVLSFSQVHLLPLPAGSIPAGSIRNSAFEFCRRNRAHPVSTLEFWL